MVPMLQSMFQRRKPIPEILLASAKGARDQDDLHRATIGGQLILTTIGPDRIEQRPIYTWPATVTDSGAHYILLPTVEVAANGGCNGLLFLESEDGAAAEPNLRVVCCLPAQSLVFSLILSP